MNPKEALLNFGLKEKEADIYLALLQLGSATAQQIAKKTGILRQTTYDSLDRLFEQGLIQKTVENNVTVFIPQKPEHILTLLEEKKNVFQSSLQSFKNLELQDDSIITLQFKGMKGIKTLYQEFLEAKDIFTIQPDVPETYLKEFFVQNFLIKRIEKKISIRIIKKDIKTDFQKDIVTDKNKFREVRLVDSLNDIKDHIIIYDNNLVFIDYENSVGVKITHKMFVNSHKQIFETLWDNGKEV